MESLRPFLGYMLAHIEGLLSPTFKRQKMPQFVPRSHVWSDSFVIIMHPSNNLSCFVAAG